MEIPEKVTLLYHTDCDRAHWTLGEIRKCAGTWVHEDQVSRISYVCVTDEELELIEALRKGTLGMAIMKNGTKCGHPEFSDGYCAEMICKNYYSRSNA